MEYNSANWHCREVVRVVQASGLADLAAALANWAASRAGTRRGPKIAFPKLKGKRSVLSVRFTTGAFGLPDQDRRHVRLPRIGLVRTHESTRKLARRVDAGTARIRSVTVRADVPVRAVRPGHGPGSQRRP